MSILALDYGEKKIGVAISGDHKVAYQLPVIIVTSTDLVIEKIQEICQSNDVGKIVVGMPKDLKGKVGEQGRKILKFVDLLYERLNIPIVYQNEALTSEQALERMIEAGVPRRRRKKLIHSFSAQIILEDYLRSRSTSS